MRHVAVAHGDPVGTLLHFWRCGTVCEHIAEATLSKVVGVARRDVSLALAVDGVEIGDNQEIPIGVGERALSNEGYATN